MSSFQPFIDAPFPNFAMEELASDSRVNPVPEVTPVSPARPVESPAARPDGDAVPLPELDAVEVSSVGRELSDDRVSVTRTQSPAITQITPYDPAADEGRVRNNRAIRDLIATFDTYDNSAARDRFANYLRLFANYATNPAVARAGEGAVATVRVGENSLYASLGFTPGNVASSSTYVARRMAQAIDNWLNGSTVFLPSMLSYSSGDGFRFSPLTTVAQASLRAAEMLATYDRVRVAEYLRDMAALRPEDFIFYDPTGLGALPLTERRDFLQRMEQMLEEARLDARAADLRYRISEENRLELEFAALRDDAERQRLEALEPEANSYYTMLLESVQQYSLGIISDGLD